MRWKLRPEATRPSQVLRGRPHRLTRRRSTALMIFSGRSNPRLAAAIAGRLGLELGDVQLETFANGEVYCRYDESVRDADVFLVQSSSAPVNPANDHVLELLLMINAARLASAGRISAVLPLFPYARQDKKSAPREPVSARLLAGLLEVAGADRVLTMDLHVGQIEGFFGIPVDHMTALPAFARYFEALGLRGEQAVVVSPDLGRVKAARRLARMLDADLAVVAKERPGHELAVAEDLIGDVAGRRALILDDMVVTGRTLAAASDALRAAGAAEVRVCATHAAVTSEGLETLARSSLAEIVVTDTVALDRVQLPANVTVLGVSDLLAETIRAVFEGCSVSAIFAGQNEPL